jgi:hypothetical protein
VIPLPLILAGAIVGVGLGLVVPRLASQLRGQQRPTAKAVIRTGLLALHRGRVAAAEAVEAVEDLYAEVQAELAKSGGPASATKIVNGKRRPQRRQTDSARTRRRHGR